MVWSYSSNITPPSIEAWGDVDYYTALINLQYCEKEKQHSEFFMFVKLTGSTKLYTTRENNNLYGENVNLTEIDIACDSYKINLHPQWLEIKLPFYRLKLIVES